MNSCSSRYPRARCSRGSCRCSRSPDLWCAAAAIMGPSRAEAPAFGRRLSTATISPRPRCATPDGPVGYSSDRPRPAATASQGTAVADFLLAIDQGTTSTRSILFDRSLEPVASAQQEFRQIYPRPGLVEHDPEEIWATVLATARDALARAGAAARDVAGIGITNQRETTIVWDRATGKPIHNASVGQDRRTAAACTALRPAGHEPFVAARTGLLLDPYFSATKIAWILDNVDGARSAAQAGRLAFGTVDAFLLWRLTGGKVHATDATNAARTLLLDIHTGQWDDDLCRRFGVPAGLLPA